MSRIRYPGTPQGYRVLFDCADADLLADVQIWLSKNKHAQNTAYNVNNGDVFRFEQVRCWKYLKYGTFALIPCSLVLMLSPSGSTGHMLET